MTLILAVIRMSYYAVRRGRNTGIYQTWDECRSQVNGFSKARYKKFPTREAALAFINETDEQPSYSQSKSSYKASTSYSYSRPAPYQTQQRNYSGGSYSGSSSSSFSRKTTQYTEPLRLYNTSSSSDDDSESLTSAEVYTDGCCHDNGRNNPTAGIGVYWGKNSKWNVSEVLEGRQTNNRAEIHAARRAIDQAKQQGIKNLTLNTDSQFLINGVTKWMDKWKTNGWTLSDGKPVKNQEDFEKLDRSLKGINVKWVHVRGHVGVAGNEAADKLANEGARKKVK